MSEGRLRIILDTNVLLVSISSRSNVQQIHPSYRWDLISADPDDNQFVDCAVAANAHAVVTENRHFQVFYV